MFTRRRRAAVGRFLLAALPGLQTVTGRQRQISAKVRRTELLGETDGGRPTTVDALLEAQDAVVRVEAARGRHSRRERRSQPL